jgi:hypothetical protein
MARRRTARHARPTGRGAAAAAHAALEADVIRLRTAAWADHLELIRLASLVDGLGAQVQRLSIELAEMRRELQTARAASAQPDPAVDLLAAQVAALRATTAAQQTTLSDLTRRVLDLMARLEAPTAAPPPPAAPPPVPPPVAAPVEPRSTPASVDPVAPPPVGGHQLAADDALDDETVLRLRLIRESFGR